MLKNNDMRGACLSIKTKKLFFQNNKNFAIAEQAVYSVTKNLIYMSTARERCTIL